MLYGVYFFISHSFRKDLCNSCRWIVSLCVFINMIMSETFMICHGILEASKSLQCCGQNLRLVFFVVVELREFFSISSYIVISQDDI